MEDEMWDETLEGNDETEANDCMRTLVAIVRENPYLYDKKKKSYMKGNKKELSWESVAELVGLPCGADASKMFYNMRQRFGKERRKVLVSQGKSGSGAVTPYVPKWELYHDLMFLADCIKSRKTSSSNTSVQRPPTPLQHATTPTLPQACRCPPSPSLIGNRSTCVSPWNEDVFAMLGNSESSRDDSPASPPSSSISLPTSPLPQPDADHNNEAVSSALEAMSKGVEKRVPPSDNARKRRKKEEDSFTQSFVEQNQAFSALASTIAGALQPPAPIPYAPAQPPVPDHPLLGSIKFAFVKVKEEDKIKCMLEVVALINDKYIK